jgi:hypothetical protein
MKPAKLQKLGKKTKIGRFQGVSASDYVKMQLSEKPMAAG